MVNVLRQVGRMETPVQKWQNHPNFIFNPLFKGTIVIRAEESCEAFLCSFPCSTLYLFIFPFEQMFLGWQLPMGLFTGAFIHRETQLHPNRIQCVPCSRQG
jgi:hypothetical protein